MNVSQLINEIVSEWAYRVNDGMPDVKNPTHIKELGIVLSEMGLSSVKKEIINVLTEAEEGGFKNPALNKKIRYKNDKGEDKEGIVGNLLRLPKEHPGRLAAEKTLPPEGSPERDALNKDLGGEGQPTKPEDEKGKEGGEAGGGEEDKAKAAQAMFDPKNDPAMAARMDKEKDTLAKIAGEKEVEKAKEKDSVEKQDSKLTQYINKDFDETPDKDFVGLGDAEVEEKEIEARSKFTDIQKEKGEDSPEAKAAKADWAKHMTEKNKRKGDMENAAMWDSIRQDNDASYNPKKKDGPSGGPGAEPPKQEPDRPDTTPPQDTTSPSDDSGLSPQEKYKKEKAELKRKEEEKAALEKLKIDNPDLFMTPEKQKKFAQLKKDLEVGTEKMKKAKEAADKQTKELTSKFKQRKSSEGEKLDVETTENGSFIIGVEHGEGTQSTKDTIDNIKKLSPDTKVMFVGEGGMSKDENGNLELSGEQAEIRDAVKGHFSDSKESSWDENANIADDNSPVFDEVGKALGGNKSKSKAAIWSNMVGQGDDLNADDYLDDEGKAWLVDQAKKGGSKEFDGDVDWKNLSDAQKKDLYELNFRDDQNYGETEISKAQEAYNGFRQKELDRKIKEAEDEGYTVIAPVGNSHVDMWRQRNKGEQKPEQPSAEKPEEPTTEPEQPSAEKPSDTEKPEDTKDDKEDIKKEKPGQQATSSSGKKIYSVGGGYYSDKPNGPAKYVRTENVVDLAFSDIITEDVFALFEKTISATLSNGKKITVQELPPRAVKKATQKAKAAAASYKEPEQKPQAPKGETPPTDKKVPPPPPPVPPKKAATPPPPPPTRKEEPAEPGNPKGEYKPDPNLKPKVDDKGNVAGTDIPAQNEENPNPKFVNKVSTKLDNFYKDVLDEEERAQKAVIEKMKADGKLPADFKEVHPLPFGFKHPALKDNPELQKEFADSVKKENKPPHWDLCKVSIPGTNKFCDENIGIPRDKMPQLGGKPKPGSEGEAKAKRIADQNVRKKMGLPADGEIPTDKKQEYDDLYAKENTQHVNVEKEFEDYLKSEGINVSDPVEVPASSLKATQSELVGEQIVGMVNSLEQDPNNPFITAPIMVTRDGYVIDGHHRWATIQAYNMKHTPPNGDKEPIKMKVRVVDEDIETHIPRANAFAEKMGIETMSGKGKQKDEPKPATSTKPSTLSRIKEKLKKWNKEEKEYFNMGYHKPGSDARKSISERLKDKASGAWKAVKDGFKHEVEEFKTAGKAVGKLFSKAGGWNDLSHHEKDALKAVGVKIVTTALFGAAMGGLSYGAVGFAKHVAIEFVPHVVAETFLKGAGRAALFADAEGEAEMDAQFIKFTEMIADGLENMKISPEQMEQMIDSYNKKKEEDTMKKETSIIDEIILEILNENPIKKADDVLNQTVKNPETGKDIKVASALKYKGSKNKGQIQAYQSAVGLLKKAGVSGSELGTQKKQTQIPGQGLGFRKTKEKELEPTPTATKPAKGARIIGGKDKTLAKVDTLKSKEFTQKQIPDDAKFSEKNKKFQVGPPPQPYKLPKEMFAGAKVPPRHLKALERMMNTKFSNETAKWSHFSDLPGGAGQISAQAGELMTMIGTTLDDKQAEAFYKSLVEHEQKQIEANPDLKIEGKRIVTKSWIQAAMNNRKAIRNRLAKEYPGAVIEAGSWDTEGEVEAMGLKDYKKNKGFSTDAYFKIKTKDGQQILDEVSLKKSTAVNFLNSGTGKLSEWDSNIPDEISPIVYQKNQRAALLNFGSKNLKNLQKLVAKDPEFQAIVKSKKITLEDALKKLQANRGSRDVNKVVLSAITAAAKKGDKAAVKYLQQVQDTHKKHQKDVITALGSNPKLKQGMLASIREEFPLKAVGEGEESMAIGPNSLDRAVLKNIFDTSDFNEIKEGLFAVTNEEPPYLAYKAGKKGRVIPIATIGVREDGVGYGGQIKFEMQLDKRFAKILEAANKNIYG